jgi:hypothetical protein
LGKIFDHTERDHPELTSDLPIGAIAEYRQRYRRLLKEDFYQIEGPMRHSDSEWLNRFHGRAPKMLGEVADNELDKK